MFQVGVDWNPKQAQLRAAILDPDRFHEAMTLCLELHGVVHCSELSSQLYPTFMDTIWEGMTEKAFTHMPMKRDVTVAWNIWHITRIEDIAANILIQNAEQVFDGGWMKRLNVSVKDTGNAMSDEEILALSGDINMAELRNYRNAVGSRTRQIIGSLRPGDMKRKVAPESLSRILPEGGVTEHKNSIWLLDFWGKKNVAGILLMQMTRHQIGHLNDSMRLKTKITKAHSAN